jgi:hypothetical protein
MGRLCVAGYKIFGCEELERCAEWTRMESNSKEGQGPQRAVVPVMMMMMMMMIILKCNFRLSANDDIAWLLFQIGGAEFICCMYRYVSHCSIFRGCRDFTYRSR